jgi:hypothetical protein
MPRNPQTLEELEQWVLNRQDHGKINGEPVIKTGTIEIRSGFVPGDLYDEALLIGAAFSFNKSDIGTHALLKFLASPVTEMMRTKLIELNHYESKTEFRAYIPTSLHNLAMAAKERLGWNNSQMMTLALTLFVTDLGIKEVYQQFLDQISDQSGLATAEIEQKIFDCRRYEARVKRLELSRQRGEFVSDRKLS